jgi:hypothetical protein
LIAAGVFFEWAHAGSLQSGIGNTTPNTGYDGFSMAGGHLDAIVSFAVAFALVLVGFTMTMWIGGANRVFGTLAALAAIAWAGLLAIILGPGADFAMHRLAAPVASVSFNTTYGLGFYLTAGGAVLGLLGALVAMAVGRRRVAVVPATARAERQAALAGRPAPTSAASTAPAATGPAPSASSRTPVAFPPEREPTTASSSASTSGPTQPQTR